MTMINFVSLRCVRKQDMMGKDEPELLVDGTCIWNGVIKKDETLPLQPLGEEFNERDAMVITLRERDERRGPKVIGTKTVRVGHADLQPVDFKTSGAHYELRYTVE